MSSVRERSVLYNYEMAQIVRPWQNDPRSQPLAHRPIDVACSIASRRSCSCASRYAVWQMCLANQLAGQTSESSATRQWMA
jgi:hypothetical protein